MSVRRFWRSGEADALVTFRKLHIEECDEGLK